jgi:hypothetical protein
VHRTVSHSLSLVLVLTAFGASVAVAQHPGGPSHATQKTDHANMLGTWEGKFQLSSQGTGGMELLVARDSVYRVKMQLIVDHPFPPMDLRDFKVDGRYVTWVNDLMGTTCNGTAVLDDAGAMKGEMKCDARTLTFSVSKKK